MPRPNRKARTQLSPLGQAGGSQSLPRQRSRSGPAAEEEFDLDVVGGDADYLDDDDDDDDDDDSTRARGVPETTGRKTKVNVPGPLKPENEGPPDIVHFYGSRKIRATPPVTCKMCR
jgi:hypothetical protein